MRKWQKQWIKKICFFSERRHLLLISARIVHYHKGFARISRTVTACSTAAMNFARNIALRIAIHHTDNHCSIALLIAVHHIENHCSDFELSIIALPSVPRLVVEAHSATWFMDWWVSITQTKRIWTCWKTDERTHVCLQNSRTHKQTHTKLLYDLHFTQCK